MNGVILTGEAQAQLLAESRLAEEGNETGGIILGHDLGIGSGFFIRQCGTAGPNAVRMPASFQRDLTHARALAERAAQLYGATWIGEWHTHLSELPAPSVSDMITYRNLLLDREIGFPRLLSMIALSDQDETWSNPRIYAWSISITSIRPLDIAMADDAELGRLELP